MVGCCNWQEAYSFKVVFFGRASPRFLFRLFALQAAWLYRSPCVRTYSKAISVSGVVLSTFRHRIRSFSVLQVSGFDSFFVKLEEIKW